MKLIHLQLEENYKTIPKGSYNFSNEFHVDFDISNKTISIIKNKNYIDIYNQSIENITCIVGKNGKGKTIFFELLIMPLLWRLDGESHIGKIHLLFYDKTEDKFYLQTYINNTTFWNFTFEGEEKELFKYDIVHNIKKVGTSRYSKFPLPMNIIFHSLSPFDRIYSLIKQKLNISSSEIKYYDNQLRYIGIKPIFTEEITYEYMTIINLLVLFFYEHSNKMIENLGYKFKDIEVSVNEVFFTNLKFPDYESFDEREKEIIDKYLSNYTFISMYIKYQSYQEINQEFVNAILLRYFRLSDKKIFIKFIEEILKDFDGDDFKIYLNEKLNNLEKFIDRKIYFESSQYQFLKTIVERKNEIFELNKLNDNEELKSLVKENKVFELLKILKGLTRRDILKFSINIEKENNIIDFLKLSSGEKTLLSYFANISAKINEVIEIQSKDSVFKYIKERTFMILIDEVELHLHPEWQRNFVKYMNDFFNYPVEQKINLQFVIATHSPFIVTDIFEENIIYLGENGENEFNTFGGNIFDIFKNDFYVTNTIGAFSESIIKEISEFVYFLVAFKKLKKGNAFMIRDFLNLMYENDDKESDDKKLQEEILKLLSGDDNIDFDISNNIYLKQYISNKKETISNIKIVLDKIGEDVVQTHLKSMLENIGDIDA